MVPSTLVRKTTLNRHRQRGVAAILAMMFMVILGSLAAAMAIVSQGNLTTADSHLKINRSLAAAETGMRFMIFRLNQVTANIKTTDGLIDETNAPNLWDDIHAALLLSLNADTHYVGGVPPIDDGTTTLTIPAITLGDGQPAFSATFTPHPIGPENYNAPFYQRPPYSDLTPAVSMAAPLDATWIRVRVEATDGPAGGSNVTRSIQMDFRLEKKIKFAVLSKNRVMIGRNVMIDGPIGSRFMDTHLTDGHPVQMVSDFRGLAADLDADLDAHIGNLATNDMDGDNRLQLANAAEVNGIANPAALDVNSDGFIDDYDYFLDKFDSNGDLALSPIELQTSTNIHAKQLLELIDTFGDPNRPGYADDKIDHHDRYTKIRGDVKIKADLLDWQSGAAGGRYQDYFQGPISADHGHPPLTFNAADTTVQEFGPQDFDVSTFRSMATGDLITQADAQYNSSTAGSPGAPNKLPPSGALEAVPYGSAHPYDYYDRPVYENMTFTNVTIPQGTNALFKNCQFVGVTFVDTATSNADPNFNYTGTLQPDGTPKYPHLSSETDTKTLANNLRFDGCTFEGAVVSEAPAAFTHVRNKIAFTGRTRFEIDGSVNLSDDQKKLFKRSTILTPHYSVEMGSFTDPSSNQEKVELSGTIVTGVLDVRGQVKVNGTVLTTFEPKVDEGPVVGDTTPQFNTTLGYFPSSDGDHEAELPANGVGVIQIRYDPSLALPDGINGPIDLTPVVETYYEGGA